MTIEDRLAELVAACVKAHGDVDAAFEKGTHAKTQADIDAVLDGIAAAGVDGMDALKALRTIYEEARDAAAAAAGVGQRRRQKSSQVSFEYRVVR